MRRRSEERRADELINHAGPIHFDGRYCLPYVAMPHGYRRDGTFARPIVK